jgi:hypothetical protein
MAPPGPLATLLVTLVAALGQSSALWHTIVARHEVCAEHDAVVEAQQGHEHRAVAASDAAPVRGGPVLGIARAVEGHTDHHCATCSHPRSASRDHGPVLLGHAPATNDRAHATVEGAQRAPSVPLYRLAPKHSPPVA